MSIQHVLTLDLRDDPELIAAYEAYHRPGAVWPEVEASITEAGIEAMQIYRFGPRLVMVLRVTDDFSFEQKAIADAANSAVQRWEALMDQFQQAVVGAPKDSKWVVMPQIYCGIFAG